MPHWLALEVSAVRQVGARAGVSLLRVEQVGGLMTDDISNLVGELRQRGDRMSHRAADAIEDLRYTLNNVTKMYDRACEDIQIYSEQIRDLTNKVTTES